MYDARWLIHGKNWRGEIVREEQDRNNQLFLIILWVAN